MPESSQAETEERERFLRRLVRLKASPEEVAQRSRLGRPFDYEAWLAEAGPASAAELAEQKTFLEEREDERLRSLEAELAGRGSEL